MFRGKPLIVPDESYENVATGLKKIYKKYMKSLEEDYSFGKFHSTPYEDADFDSKPMVLLIGQYSTGKTTFIKYMLQQEFPGMNIGPEPTTDGFIAVMQGEPDKSGKINESIVPGPALVSDKNKPFKGLATEFGNAFLDRFQCSQMDNNLLKNISLIDSPGVLSGDKHRINRGYDFNKVITWFAERVDRIILLFDAHKLDISDEFQEAIQATRSNFDKVRVVLNKSDQVTTQQLMRVYGALMWSLGKVISTPEVPRVFIGTFWDQPFRYTELRNLMESESNDLFKDLQGLPRSSALRKVNDLVKRAKLAKIHALIIGTLYQEMPMLLGKEAKKADLIKNLSKYYDKISGAYNIPIDDFPKIEKMQELLNSNKIDWNSFKKIDKSAIKNIDKMVNQEIAKLMTMITSEELHKPDVQIAGDNQEFTLTKGLAKGQDSGYWIVEDNKETYDRIFYNLTPQNGKIAGGVAKSELIKSGLKNAVLHKIWKLSDIDKDGKMTAEEFALAMHLIECVKEGDSLPEELPGHLVPPAIYGRGRSSEKNSSAGPTSSGRSGTPMKRKSKKVVGTNNGLDSRGSTSS